MENRLIGNIKIIYPEEQLIDGNQKDQRIGKFAMEIMKKSSDVSYNAFVHDFYIYLPICNFNVNLSIFNDLCLALDAIRPIYIDVDFFKINEQYGKTEKTIVRKEDTIVKDIFFSLNNEKYNLKSFFEKIVIPLDKVKAREIVVARHNQNHSTKERKISNTNKYYNDNLDMDQQSPEFWDNL